MADLLTSPATFHVPSASGPVGGYWWCAHDDVTAKLIFCWGTHGQNLTLHHYQVPPKPFFLHAQASNAEWTESGPWSPCSDVYQFQPVPEPSAALLLVAGLAGLLVLRRK